MQKHKKNMFIVTLAAYPQLTNSLPSLHVVIYIGLAMDVNTTTKWDVQKQEQNNYFVPAPQDLYLPWNMDTKVFCQTALSRTSLLYFKPTLCPVWI